MRGASLRPRGVPMLLRSQIASTALARSPTSSAAPYICRQCIAGTVACRRAIQISAAPATEYPPPASGDAFTAGRDDADARFEILGSPYSLLSVSLSASQNLYTRRGTLVSVAGKVDNATSTLSLMSPVRRALLGIPFLYQRISSTTPLTLLIGTKAAHTTLFTLHLDGTTDWVVAQRNALLAWTGHTLSVTPQRGEGTAGLGIAHWGTSFVTGRGLVALSAPGYIYPVTLAAGEELVVHPSHVVAYAVNKQGAPTPFRLRSSKGMLAAAAEAAKGAVSSAASTAQIATKAVRLRLQTPGTVASEPGGAGRVARFWDAMRTTSTYKFLARALFDTRTVLRRTVWGDRLFVHVRGPTTLLLSSRGVRVAEVLTRDNVNEIADTEAGTVAAAVELASNGDIKDAASAGGDEKGAEAVSSTASSTVAIHVAEVKPSGKVEFTDAKDLKEFVR
ncbi:Altered inheritance of mitochondria protein 24, mitochondrial [Sporothrix curviconia]|uniref:Altered inheritance of mitochondria protein 24, mitochondrial n=1 Tax=Sporothrix curviconia TaxID=1260050 RepID=A0ABP0C5J7_9PEZI